MSFDVYTCETITKVKTTNMYPSLSKVSLCLFVIPLVLSLGNY